MLKDRIMRCRILLIFVLSSGAFSPATALELPTAYPRATFTDSPTGCPSNDGRMVVRSEGYTVFVSRKSANGQQIVDAHECTVAGVAKTDDGHAVQVKCSVLFKDINRMRLETVVEYWKLEPDGSITIATQGGQTTYRPCKISQ